MSTVNKNPHAVALGRLGRKKNTPAQQEAARENGKKGGRPRTSKHDDLSKPMSAENIDLVRKQKFISKKYKV